MEQGKSVTVYAPHKGGKVGGRPCRTSCRSNCRPAGSADRSYGIARLPHH